MSTTKSPVIMDATEMMKGLKPEDLKALLKNKISDSMHQNVSPAVQKKINALKNVQVNMLEVEAKFYDELHELELKYAKTYEPLYEKRRTIVNGEYEPTEEESKWALDDETENGENSEDKKMALENGAEEEKEIKNFWLETLQSFRITSEIIQEYDEEILGYLQDIQVKLFDKKPYGYTLEFFFAENPFFSNKTLTKTYILKTEVDPKDPFAYDGPDLEKATGCTISWKEGKNVCMKMVKKKLKSKNKKQPPKIVTKEEKQDSFFNFFETPKIPAKSEDKQVAKKSESEAEDNDEEHDQELYLIADFEIGQYLKEKIIPKAILFFIGEGVDDEFDEDDYDEEDEEDEEGDEDEDDDEDDDEEDDDEDDDDDKKQLGKKAAKGKKGKNGEPTPSECKQN